MAKILVVEDESIVAWELQSRLQNLGYSVPEVAFSGEDALSKCEEVNPDLVLMDIVLKGKMDGIETAEYIVSHYGIPVVYLTAHSDEKTLERAKTTVPYGYVLKPIQDRELHITIEMALHAHEMGKKLKESEKRYRKSEEQWRTLFNNAVLGIYRTTPEGNILMANPALVRMLGYTTFDELRQRNLGEDGFEPESPRSEFKECIEREGEIIGLESAWKRKDGTTLFVRENARAICDSTGTILYYEGTVEDITQRKSAEETLQAERDKLRALFGGLNRTQIGIDIVRCDYRIMFVNETLRREFGDVVGHVCYQKFMGQDEPCDPCPMTKAIQNGTVENCKLLDSHGRHIELISAPLPNPDGTVDRALEVTIDITERIETERALRANQLKSEFLASMSHEFRTPLNSILSFTELMLLELDGSVTSEQKQDLEMIKESGEDLLALVNNLLDLSKIEAGRVELYTEPVDPVDVVAVVTSQLAMKALEKGLSLTTDVFQDVPVVMADEARLRQVLRNLVENALKYTEEGGVHIGVYYENGEVIFSVKDTGIGIAQEDLKIIFDKFSQARREPTKKFGGAGLGLSVAKELVELHGGKIWVESEKGTGSTFSFSMPPVQK